MKKAILTNLIIVLLTFSLSVSAAQMTYNENEVMVTVEGTATTSETGEYVTLMLLKNSTDYENVLPTDFTHVDQGKVDENCNYKFEFKVNQDINIDD